MTWVYAASTAAASPLPQQTTTTVTPEASETATEAPARAARWNLGWGGYLRAGLIVVEDDPDLDFVGNNDGFVLHNARLEVHGDQPTRGLAFRVSLEGATDLRNGLDTPQGTLDLRLRDAWLQYAPISWVGLRVGQQRTVFDAEQFRSTARLAFADRALAQRGVRVGQGFELEGLGFDRELGASLGTMEPVAIGPVAVEYIASLSNGNGINQLLNDNNSFAVSARVAVTLFDLVRLGGSWKTNERRAGRLPNQFRETDTGFAGDVRVHWSGLHVAAQYTVVNTTFETLQLDDRQQLGWHVEAAWAQTLGPVVVQPAYRFSTFDPWASGRQAANGSAVDYGQHEHAAAVRVSDRDDDIAGIVQYAVPLELDDTRSVDNNRLSLVLQVRF